MQHYGKFFPNRNLERGRSVPRYYLVAYKPRPDAFGVPAATVFPGYRTSHDGAYTQSSII